MNSIKTGQLIEKLRKEKGMTQREVAEKLNISDKTVSKWETGAGCPDIGILNELAEVLGVNITEILSGEMVMNKNDIGNMKKTKFYYCDKCGNIITSTSELLLTCCGNALSELEANKTKESHLIQTDYIEDDLFVSMDHEMKKDHYLSFMAYITCDKLYIQKLYPEQNAEARFKNRGHGLLYVYCRKHGLFVKQI